MPAEIVSPTAVGRDRYQIANTGLGLISQNFDRQLVVGGNLISTGAAQFGSLGVRAGDIVTNICVISTVVGAGQTLVKVGLFSKTGVQLGISADVKADLASGIGVKQEPLIAAYTVPTDDVYIAGILGVGGTQPTLGRCSASTAGSFAVGSFALPYAQQGSLADMPAPAVFAATGISFWFGVT